MPRARLQLELTPEAIARVEEIRKLAKLKTKADVVQNAILLYEWFLRQREDGWLFQTTKGDRVREVEFIL